MNKHSPDHYVEKAYKNKPVKFPTIYKGKTHKESLTAINLFYRGGEISDKKPAILYDSVEDLYSAEPFYYRVLQKFFPVALASVIHACVPNSRGNQRVDYSALPEYVFLNVLSHMETKGQLEFFDEGLLQHLQYSGQIDDYFDGEKCRIFEQQIDGIAARFFRSHSEGLFDTFGETATPSSMLANAEAAVNFAEVLFRRGELTTYDDIRDEAPALYNVMMEYHCNTAVRDFFQISDADIAFFDAWSDSYPSKTYNPSSLSHSGVSGDAKAYDIIRKYPEHTEHVMSEKGIFLDKETNALYALRFNALGRSFVKVGVTNYNYAFVRFKNLQNGIRRTQFEIDGRVLNQDEIEVHEISEGELIFLGSENHKIFHWVESEFKRLFEQSGLTVVKESANFPTSELLDISGREEEFQKELAGTRRIAAQMQEAAEEVFYTNFVENNYSKNVAQTQFVFTDNEKEEKPTPQEEPVDTMIEAPTVEEPGVNETLKVEIKNEEIINKKWALGIFIMIVILYIMYRQ